MFGAAQLAWLKRELLASKAAVKILANGSEWESFGSVDSYSCYCKLERDALLKWIADKKIEGVILLSGDRHFCAVLPGARDVSWNSSAAPSAAAMPCYLPNAERFTGHDEGCLWMILDIDTTGAAPALAYEIHQAGGGMLERRSLTWDEVNGRATITPAHAPAFTTPALRSAKRKVNVVENCPEDRHGLNAPSHPPHLWNRW